MFLASSFKSEDGKNRIDVPQCLLWGWLFRTGNLDSNRCLGDGLPALWHSTHTLYFLYIYIHNIYIYMYNIYIYIVFIS